MDIKQFFEKQLKSAERITENTIQKIIEGRKQAAKDPNLPDEAKERMTCEDTIREQYPIGDKTLYAIVYPSKNDIKSGDDTAQVMTVLESELEDFEKNHRSLGAHPEHDVPRFVKKNNYNFR